MIDPIHRRGDIWTVDFGIHPEDPEQALVRPTVIVSADQLHHPRLRMTILIPGTTYIRDIPLHVRVDPDVVNGLDTVTGFQVEQIRAVAASRLLRRVGKLDGVSGHTIDEILRTALALH